ncbi:MAG TPA: Co2+/Mg2+ efflux protein ApaG, partial [Longimicrobiales bacterium]|nr:Co2+/Mg2+ efflux protein ApaG [Longimicrobiales bacterium]
MPPISGITAGADIADQANLAIASPHMHRLRMQPLHHRITNDIRVTVRPRYSPEHSDEAEPRFVFVYHIRIENVGSRTAQLRWRHWYIHDELAGDSEVEGEGVVGEQPVLAPGDAHDYESFCVLRGTRGHMEGYYEFRRTD